MNPFAVLESDDEDESFTKVQSKKNDSKKKATQPKQNAPPTTSAQTSAVNNSEKKNSGRGGGGRGDNRHHRGAGRGGKETGQRVGKTGKREFDRRSGTGRGNEVAKGGAGKGGWGTNEDEIAAQRRELEEGGETTTEPNEKTEEVVVVEEPVEPEAPTFTMDEFLARREAERSNSSIFKKVEERAVTDDFSNLKKRTSNESESFIVLKGVNKTKSNNGQGQRSSDKTKLTDLGFHAPPKEDYREGRGDRGNRGGRGERGGRGKGGGRGERRSAPRGGRVDINDQSAFPSL